MNTNESKQRDRMFLKLFLKSAPSDVTDEELDYFREHPDQIDEVTAPVNIHKLFLWVGKLLGVACVALSKAIKFYEWVTLSEGYREFVIDIVFEVGVALIGAAVTAYNPLSRSLLDSGGQITVGSLGKPEVNDDGSVDIFFGPKDAPKGKEKNWIRTSADKGFFVVFRFYGPLEGYIEKTWVLNDFERVE